MNLGLFLVILKQAFFCLVAVPSRTENMNAEEAKAGWEGQPTSRLVSVRTSGSESLKREWHDG